MLDSNIYNTYSQVPSDPIVSVAVAAPDGVARRGQPPQANAPLGNTTKSVEICGYTSRRQGRYVLHKSARRLLPDMRVASCMTQAGNGGVEIVQAPSGIASFRGLHACGSVWVCPICSAKIANTRRAELNKLLVWGREQGLIPVLLTLTMRHGFDDALSDSLEALKAAKKRLRQSHAWVKVKNSIVGHVTATEVTYGASGWHPHNHILMLVDALDEDRALEIVETLRLAWTSALEAGGYDCNEHGFQTQGAAEAGDYVAKWGPAEELSLTGTKRARGDQGKGLSPWQLLAGYGAGDLRAGALFATYAYAFQGRRQLVWSPGLKKLASIEEAEDKDIANADDAPLGVSVAVVEPRLWVRIVKHDLRVTLLEVVEQEGAAALQAYLSRLRRRFGVED